MSEGGYRIVEVRDGGPFGAVCVVRDESRGRPVAFKVLRSTLLQDPAFLMRIRDEARLLGRLNHPNIIRVEGLISILRRPVIVMEAPDGVNTRQLLARNPGGLPADVSLELVRRATRAVHDAYHGFAGPSGGPLRLIHRDLRPRNLFVSVHGELKLLDFGLSRAQMSDRESSTASRVLGAGAYAAPEQYRGEPDSPAVDVYALGLILAELVTGRATALSPEAGAHVRDVEAFLAHLDRASAGGLAEPIKGLVKAMCAYHAADRPETDEVLARIREIQVTHDALGDLVGFATEVVVSAHAASADPREHPDWPEVRFLEGASGPDPDDPDQMAAVADQHVRAFLARTGWELRYRELRDLLAVHRHWSPRPFLEILERADAPWWRFWQRPSPEQLEVALRALKRRPLDEVIAQARPFLDHEDPKVSRAALALVRRGADPSD